MTNSPTPRKRTPTKEPQTREKLDSAAEAKIPEKPPLAVVETQEELPVTEAKIPDSDPNMTLQKKIQEVEQRGEADLSTGQRIGARLIAMSEMRKNS
jgi:hypothetical protein